MKKSIILLITLFFISIISLYILSNLADTGKLIKRSSYVTNITQIQISMENIKEQLINLNKKNPDLLSSLFSSKSNGLSFNLAYKNIKATIFLSKITDEDMIYSDINKLAEGNAQSLKYYKNLFQENHVYNFGDFLQILKEYKIKYLKVTNFKQIYYIIDKFKRITNNNDINKIKNQFYIFDENSNVLKCQINVKVSDLLAKSTFLLDTKSGEIENYKFLIKK